MDIDEADGLTECWACNVTISESSDPVFPFGEAGLLCFECAVQRGGAYDAKQERWLRPPDVTDLPDERRSEALE
jgi:hypothetical protein